MSPGIGQVQRGACLLSPLQMLQGLAQAETERASPKSSELSTCPWLWYQASARSSHRHRPKPLSIQVVPALFRLWGLPTVVPISIPLEETLPVSSFQHRSQEL